MATTNLDESDGDSESMSIVPYDSHRDVVLRHANSVVYFDPASRQLTLRNTTRDIDTRSPTRTECPTCGRLWQDNATDTAQPTAAPPEEQPTFINHDYFRLLARSLPGSTDSTAPPSPRRRTIQPAHSRLSSPAIVPPPNAEFLGSAPAPPSPSHGISETAFAPQYFARFFVVEKELGRGGRGVVLLVKHVLDGVTLGHFACKRVPIGDDHTWLEKVLVEVQALQSLSHQNLVSYRHVWLEDYQLNNFGPSVPCAFILQQYCNGGDVHNYVCGSAKVQITTQELKERMRRRSRGESDGPRATHESRKLHFDEIHSFFRDITAGLQFLHLNGFIHRDLKPSNCLLHTIGGETRVLVSDFGEVQYEKATRKSTGATGTISYCAPEVLRRVTPDGPFGNFTFKSDIFSLGMILHFLCFANLPYRYANVLHEEREDLDELRSEIVAWAGFDDQRRLRPELPAQLYSFLKRLLALNAEERPTASDVTRGIRLGGLENVPDSRRRRSMGPEELTPGKRIERLDSPAQGNSPRRSSSRDLDNIGSIPEIRRRAPSKDASDQRRSLNSLPDVAVEEDADEPSSIGMERSASAPPRSLQGDAIGSHSVALIRKARTSLSSPTLLSPPRSPSKQPRFLLPPPRQTRLQSWSTRLRLILFADVTSPTTRITILSIKILTVLQPCLSSGANASILYPLLAFAVVETAVRPFEVWKAIVGLVFHALVLYYAIRTGKLCSHSATWS